MVKKQLNTNVVDHGQNGWDADAEANRQAYEDFLVGGALPIFSVPNFASLPAAADNEEAIAIIVTGTSGNIELAISDGTTWRRFVPIP